MIYSKPRISVLPHQELNSIYGEKLKEFYLRSRKELELKLSEADRKDIDKYGCCAEYAGEVTTYLCDRQKITAAHYGYMISQLDVNSAVRSTLVDWMIGISEKLNLRHETLFMAVNILDRYLNLEKLTKAKFQLLGVTALVLAAKYEEIYPPETRDFINLTKKPMMKEEIFAMESKILQKLNFELSGPSPLRFIERFSKLTGASEYISNLALYYCELQLLNYDMLKHLPSMIAAACVYLAFTTAKGEGPNWNDYVKAQSQCEEKAVKNCAKEMLEGFKDSEKNELFSAKKRFSQKKYMEVGRMEINTLIV